MAADSSEEVQLTEHDIPGAILNESLENATVPQLKWWLLCRGIQSSSTARKLQLIDRYIYCSLSYKVLSLSQMIQCSRTNYWSLIINTRKAKELGAKVIGVVGSYLYRK